MLQSSRVIIPIVLCLPNRYFAAIELFPDVNMHGVDARYAVIRRNEAEPFFSHRGSMTGTAIVSLLGPKIRGPDIGENESSNPRDLFDAVFGGCH